MSLYKKSYRNNFLVSMIIHPFFSCENKQNQNSDKEITAQNIASKDSATKESFLKSLGVPTEAIDKDGKYKAPEVTAENIKNNSELIKSVLENANVPSIFIDDSGKFILDNNQFFLLLFDAVKTNKLELFNYLCKILNELNKKEIKIDIKNDFNKDIISIFFGVPKDFLNERNSISIKVIDEKIKISLNSLTYESISKSKSGIFFFKKIGDAGIEIEIINDSWILGHPTQDIYIRKKIAEIKLNEHCTIDNSDNSFIINENGYKYLNQNVSPFTYCKTFSVENNSIKVENQIIYNTELKDLKKGPVCSKIF